MSSSSVNRNREIQRVRALLERDACPRLRMFEMVASTGISGFVASYGLLHAGLVAMWARYPVAIAIAYAVFVFLLWLFLRSPQLDSIELADDVLAGPRSLVRSSDGPGKGDLGGSSFWSSSAPDLDLPIVAILVGIVALLLSATLIINAAPLLFAELIVDSALAAGLVRRLQGSEGPRYLETALQRTFAPFAIAVVLAAISGWALQHYAPEARSIVDVLVHASKAR